MNIHPLIEAPCSHNSLGLCNFWYRWIHPRHPEKNMETRHVESSMLLANTVVTSELLRVADSNNHESKHVLPPHVENMLHEMRDEEARILYGRTWQIVVRSRNADRGSTVHGAWAV